MVWQGIVGHDQVVERFRRALRRGRLATSFLFVGPEGVGRRTFALKLAQSLLCQDHPEAALDPCGRCTACVQVEARTHPDLSIVCRPPDRAVIPLRLLIGEDEHRMHEGLCHDLSLKPFMGRRKVAIIDDADHLNPEGANCLLKTLEEPPPRSVLILIGTSSARQLPTIRSRCQLVRFQPLPPELIAQLLAATGLVADEAQARRLAQQSGGSLHRAMELADSDLWAFRDRLLQALAAPVLDSTGLAAELVSLVDSAGKEAAARRNRLRRVFGLAAEHFRELLRGLVARDDTNVGAGDEPDRDSASRRIEVERTAACLERCLDALEQLDRNANQSTLIECWTNDLAIIKAEGT
jgi:DNA polymerase-3 subunit delta'